MTDISENPNTPEHFPLYRKARGNLKKWLFLTLIPVGLIVIIWVGVYTYFSYTNQFPIQTVKVLGSYSHLNEEDISNTLRPFVSGKGLFAFSESDAEEALEQIPGVASVSIWRVPPAKIKVIIRERSAIARFANGSLLSDKGIVFTTGNPTGADNLPLLNGDPRYAEEMMKMLESLEPVFGVINAQLTGLGLAENGDWSVQINNQTWIMLGKDNLQKRLTGFLTAYPDLLQSAPKGAASLLSVDLRYGHGFSAAWSGYTPAATGS